MNRCAHRILRTLSTGGRKANVLRGLAFTQLDFEQAIGQLFLTGQVQWNGKAKARVLTLKARVG
jgi:hypothetical protein